MATCAICNQEAPFHDDCKHGPMCSQHKVPPGDCFRLHNPTAFREQEEDQPDV